MKTLTTSGNILYICVAVATFCFATVEARLWLEAPAVANCRGDTVLNCHYCDTPLATRTWSRKIGSQWEVVMENGTVIGPWHRLMIKEEINGWISLIISGVDNISAGIYRCGVGQYQSEAAELKLECKPVAAEVRITPDRFIEIRMNTVYPVPALNFTLTGNAQKDTPVSFPYPECRGHSWLQDCVWTSQTMFPSSQYRYILIATTLTDTTFTGIIN